MTSIRNTLSYHPCVWHTGPWKQQEKRLWVQLLLKGLELVQHNNHSNRNVVFFHWMVYLFLLRLERVEQLWSSSSSASAVFKWLTRNEASVCCFDCDRLKAHMLLLLLLFCCVTDAKCLMWIKLSCCKKTWFRVKFWFTSLYFLSTVYFCLKNDFTVLKEAKPEFLY